MRRFPIIATTLILLATLINGCRQNAVYMRYEEVGDWQSTKKIAFLTDSVTEDVIAEELLGLRIRQSYPYKSITVVVQQKILPYGNAWDDTVRCEFTDKAGRHTANGFGYLQYEFPIRKVSLHKGEKVELSVRHVMKKEYVSGVSDVGIIIR